ncbi:MAG TPA: hypothetical protein VFL82_09875 [Thermomicrobiales bacterium]|jgi:hypothetical protein|nr:hypothetical protein [Thermomicrobiales bacterium]
MVVYFELMDLSTANVVGHFSTEDEALALVQRVLTEEGADAVEDLALSRQARDERPALIAIGRDLAERAVARSASAA